ncbi:MAG: RHS repeat-associated core domain-containing protein, partial [Verrucomicrobiota bacterium]
MKLYKNISKTTFLGIMFLVFVAPSLHSNEEDNPPPPPRVFPSYNWSLSVNISPPTEAFPNRYRKVGLNGMPISDEKPQQKEETDEAPEETYLDAMTLGLNHSTTDLYMPMPASELNLSVRRNATSEVYIDDTSKTAYHPSLRPDLPFGLCWSSNLSPNIRISAKATTSYDGIGTKDSNISAFRYERYAHITDNDGSSYRFIVLNSAEESWEGGKDISKLLKPPLNYFALPSGNHDADAMSNTLAMSGSHLVFTKKFGTTLRYSKDPVVTESLQVTTGARPTSPYIDPVTSQFLSDAGIRIAGIFPPKIGSITIQRELYHRLEEVEDKYGNKLIYHYGNGDIKPTRIEFVPVLSPERRQINITYSSGRVSTITDPNGNVVEYNYPAGSLTKVVKKDSAGIILSEVSYGYETVIEGDTTPQELRGFVYPPVRLGRDGPLARFLYEQEVNQQTHCNLNYIRDSNGNEYSFTYQEDRTRSHYAKVQSDSVSLPQDRFSFAAKQLYDNYSKNFNFEGYYPVSGFPRYISKIDLPDGSEVTTANQSQFYMTYYSDSEMRVPSYLSENIFTGDASVRLNSITDAVGQTRTYRFNGSQIMETNEYVRDATFESKRQRFDRFLGFVLANDVQLSALNISTVFNERPKLLVHNALTIEYPLDNASEKFDFNAVQSFGPIATTDFSGNTTRFSYSKGIPNLSGAALITVNTNYFRQLTSNISGPRSVSNSFTEPTVLGRFFADPNLQTDALGQEKSFQYDVKWHVMTEIIDERGIKTEYEIDSGLPDPPYGLRTKETIYDSDGTTPRQVTDFTYDNPSFPGFMDSKSIKDLGADPVTWVSDLTTLYEPDALGYVQSETVVMGSEPDLVTSHDYDQNGNKISTTDPRGFTTYFVYDGLNRLIRVVYPPAIGPEDSSAPSKSMIYDDRNKVGEIDENGNITVYHYDSLNRLVRQIRVMDDNHMLSGSDPSTFTSFFNPAQVDSTTARLEAHLFTDFEYNSVNSKITEMDPNGNITRFEYDEIQRLIAKKVLSTENPSLTQDIITQYEYDSTANPGASAFSQDGFKPTKIIGPKTLADGNPQETYMVYDSLYREIAKAVEVEPGKYAITHTSYDQVGNPVEQTAFRDTQTMANPDPAQIMSFTPMLNVDQVTETDFDSLNRPVMTRFAVESQGVVNNDYGFISMAYTSTGLEYETIDEEGRVTNKEYDLAGRATKVIQPLVDDGIGGTANPLTQTVYDLNGNVVATINPLGRQWDFTFDERNRKITETQPAVVNEDNGGALESPFTETFYDDVGNVTAVTDARGNTTETVYDRANRPTHVITPATDAMLNNGSVASHFGTTLNIYDENGNILETIQGGATTLAVAKAAQDQTDLVEGRVNVTNTYDALNRLLTTTDAEEILVTNQYDEVGNRTAVIDGKDQRSDFDYDGLNRNTQIIYGVGGAADTTTYSFNALNKTKRLDAKGVNTHYEYDKRNRLTKVFYDTVDNTNAIRKYAYDKVGNLKEVIEVLDDVSNTPAKNSAADVAYAYDALNRIIQETSGGVTHTYTYDLAGNRLSNVYGDTNLTCISTYDALNRLDTMTESSSRVTDYDYDLNGNIRVKTLPNGDMISTSYDALNRQAVISASAASNLLYSYDYEYDLFANVREVVEDYNQADNPTLNLVDRIITNEYDNINRLVKEEYDLSGSSSIKITAYTYDFAHNRIQKSTYSKFRSTGLVLPDSGLNVNYTYNELNQLLVESTSGLFGNITSTYSYDANGNRTLKVFDDGSGGGSQVKLAPKSLGAWSLFALTIPDPIPDTVQYIYDVENRLVLINDSLSPNQGIYQYSYDYRTRRVGRDESLASGDNTKVVFSGGTSAQEYDNGASSPSVEYIRGSDYGGGIGGILYTLRSGTPSYTHNNSRGDIVAKTNAGGTITYQAQYEAFGTRTEEFGSTEDRQKANSKDEDPTGLLNEGFRYRDLEAGVFITRDPLGFVDGPNVYTYVNQNPWTYFDPTGLYGSYGGSQVYDSYSRDLFSTPEAN